MESQSYSALVSLASGFVDRAKVIEVLTRQLATCKLDPARLSASDVRGAATRLSTVLGLYMSDESKRKELSTKLSAF
jgi:hypothetical protein